MPGDDLRRRPVNGPQQQANPYKAKGQEKAVTGYKIGYIQEQRVQYHETE